jgi:hypothetical protein
VSDTNKPAPKPAPSVELTKKRKAAINDASPKGADAAAATTGATASEGTPPRSIGIALYAIYAQLAFAVAYAILSWPLGNQLHKSIIDSNSKAKTPKKLCGVPRLAGCLDVNKTVHTVQIETAVGTVLVGFVVVLMIARIRRGTRSGRTFYIAASVLGALVGFAGSPISLLSVASSGPAIPRVVSTLAAVSSVVAIVMLFRSDSQRFFDLKSPRPARGAPGSGGAAGAARPGLGSLFRPRPLADSKPPANAKAGVNGKPQVNGRRSPVSPTSSAADSRSAGRLAKAKSRNDAEAVARGAAMARTRARSSKSRRTDI